MSCFPWCPFVPRACGPFVDRSLVWGSGFLSLFFPVDLRDLRGKSIRFLLLALLRDFVVRILFCFIVPCSRSSLLLFIGAHLDIHALR